MSENVKTLVFVAVPALAAAIVALGQIVDLVVWAGIAALLIAALGLLWWRLSTAVGGGGPDLRPLVDSLLNADYATSQTLVAAGGDKAAAWQSALAVLRERSEAAAESQQREMELQRSFDQHLSSLKRMGDELTSLGESLAEQSGGISEVTEAAERTLESHSGTRSRIDDLTHSAEESSSSIIEMVTINNEVRENVHNLASSVDETTTAIEEMTFSSKEVAKNIEELSTAAEETAASMNQMDVSINQVETNATETSRLSEQVTSDAETGVSAINHTIRGIDTIKESSRVASEVITNLGQKINQIGNILNVIDDVAEQTNLLALNAAIIAAQAGEHGRGFAVVADEIKALAERTGSSTKEIAGLIRTIQEESRNAVNVMSKGVEDVEEGVRLGHNAEDALRKIVESAKRSTLMIHAIAQATVEQAKGSKQVTNAISRIAETVQQIAFATAEQAKGAEHIMQSAERMKIITQQVERSADEQNRGGTQVTQAIENIRDMADKISRSARDDEETSKKLAGAIETAGNASTRSHQASEQLQRLLGDVEGQVGGLLS